MYDEECSCLVVRFYYYRLVIEFNKCIGKILIMFFKFIKRVWENKYFIIFIKMKIFM